MTEAPFGLTRRDFFRLGAVAGPASIVAACGWDGGPVLEPKLKAFSRINDWVGEKVLLSPSSAGRGNIRYRPEPPMQNFPSYSITYNRHRIVPVAPERQRLGAGGRRPGTEADAADPSRPGDDAKSDIHRQAPLCRGLDGGGNLDRRAAVAAIWRWSSRHRQRGISGSTRSTGLLQRLGSHERHASTDDPGLRLQRPPTDDEPWRSAPALLPIKLGYKLTKYLTAMTFTRERPGGYWEDQGYPWFGGV